ncbi:MAG: DUF2794 domain-containing protein [Aestuariivita sp.]|nr:DUF2794 domain-containing protein [Aestuariivita sp.]MCY4348066.1 DUF2794 domain-containing protein [Aestuariivita sp.]
MTPLTQVGIDRERYAHPISFDRAELAIILRIYGRMVAAGEWRDYGISNLRDRAVFSIFRRAAENPIFQIEKHPKQPNPQSLYRLVSMDGQVLKRGQHLDAVMRELERKLIRAVK